MPCILVEGRDIVHVTLRGEMACILSEGQDIMYVILRGWDAMYDDSRKSIGCATTVLNMHDICITIL